MKHFFIFLIAFFSLSLNAQVSLKCYTYENFSSSDCYGCNLKTGHFSGIIVSTEGVKIALHKPIKVTYKASSVFFEDAFGNKFNSQLSRINQNVPTFVSECLKGDVEIIKSDVYNPAISGETNVLYVDTNTSTVYVWDGTKYVTSIVRCKTDHCMRRELLLKGWVSIDTIIPVDSTIFLYSSQQLLGNGKAELVSHSALTNIVQVEGNNARVSGVKFTGTKTYAPTSSTQINTITNAVFLNGIGNQKGIFVDSAKYVKISNCHFYKLDYGLSASFGVPGNCSVSDCSFLENYIGLDVPARWEYNTFSNLHQENNLIGTRYVGGNNNATNICGFFNRIGLMMANGNNGAHYSLANSNFNHSYFAGIIAKDLTYQANLTNIQTWSTSPTSNDVIIDNAKVFWVGGYIDKNVTVTNPLISLISNVVFSNTAAVTGTINLRNNWRDNGTTTGVQN